MHRLRSLIALTLPLLSLAGCGGAEPAPGAPGLLPSGVTTTTTPAAMAPSSQAEATTPKRPVVDEYHGTRVTDDYRWLEKSDDPEVKAWIASQARRARAALDALPHRGPIRERVSEIVKSSSASWIGLTSRAGQVFALKLDPPKQQPLLVVMKSADDKATERVVVDPNTMDAAGKSSIDFFVPSPDGKKVAVSLSERGSEDGTVHVIDVATGKETGDVIPRVNGGTAGGSVAWTADNKGFYYTRYPSSGERPAEDVHFFQQVYFHELGAPIQKDKYSIGKDFPRIAEVQLSTGGDGRYLVASVANGDGGEFAHYLLGPSGKWVTLAEVPDKVREAKIGADNKLYLLSLNGSPKGKILRLPLDRPVLAGAEAVVPESDATIESFEVTKSRLFVAVLAGGPSQIHVFDGKGKALPAVPTLPVSSAGRMVSLGGDDILFRNASYLSPPGWYRYRAADGKTSPTALMHSSSARFDDAEVVREMCTSKDGTKVPLNIIRKKGTKLDGTNPTLLTGYGGYGISLSPSFGSNNRIWLDQGGVLAIANLRGGGEFGEEWHLAGNLTRKQNVFDDFIACASYLVSSGHTKPEKLAIMGGSNGGLLMGAVLTQRPDLFKAVVSSVGIYDMLRVELTPNGQFNVPEFGTTKDPSHFKAMFAYSPYHNVKDGTAYPAVLFSTGENDPRVDPYHSRKMLARLQAASASKAPVLLRASSDIGHGMGTPMSEMIEQTTDGFAFLFHELAVAYKPVAAAAKP